MTFIPVGRVVAVHGVRGEVKFRYYNETHRGSLQYRSFFLDENGKKIELEASHARPQGASIIIKFKGLNRVEEIGFLLKRELLVREDQLPLLEDGEYYDYQLIGLQVVTENGAKIGRVREIMHTKANDVLLIEGAHEVLVPMTEEHVLSVELGAGSITVREDGIVG